MTKAFAYSKSPDSSSQGLLISPWTLTGETEYRRSVFGHVVLWVREGRRAFRPVVAAYSASNWVTENRWRRAHVADILTSTKEV